MSAIDKILKKHIIYVLESKGKHKDNENKSYRNKKWKS